ncbi:Polysaccharide biosynthesis/export protein [Roseimaritima multifibrata]|uniref:Polysaccharide biosynthesis/export protein n=1 Tax=Roseimaritima multifibrata TaxID=1930274 RepID=A0A517MAT8_9BACT|nr:polysaccharide biosynthesis/export family protein [Roseimaritima multifibrata]QDS92000.1 Polysaccharide biosynthesis/export protein [Roseimaritima multifibrata]
MHHRRNTTAQRSPFALCTLLLIALSAFGGCAIRGAVPASQLPDMLRVPRREAKIPLDLSLLSQPMPAEHVVQAGDVLGIHIEDILGDRGLMPTVAFLPGNNGESNLLREPAVGQPIQVQHSGTIRLPMADPIYVSGLTLPQVYDRIRQVYVQQRKLLKAGKENIQVNLIRPRSQRVMVIREDSSSLAPTVTRDDTRIVSRRGSADVIELPAYENDVLHALVRSGGLPGLDGLDEVWVLRSKQTNDTQRMQAVTMLREGESYDAVSQCIGGSAGIHRIPLRLRPDAPLPFGPEDILLYDNDVLFVPARDKEYFLTGGLLGGAKIPLPRDHDVDVLEAIAIANGHIDGPVAATTSFVNGPGNVFPPSRVLLVRRWGREQQMKIEVDIHEAMNNPRERIIIQPGDLVILKYTPTEIVLNAALNTVNLNYSLNDN